MGYTKGQCIECAEGFWYWRYRQDKHYCSKACANRSHYVTKGSYPDRNRRSKMTAVEWKEHKKDYDQRRLEDPQVRAARNERGRARYATEAYRLYARNRYRRISSNGSNAVSIQHGYTDHRWFDLVRQHVGPPPAEDSVFFDRWADRMGAGLLALCEGRDIKEAIAQHNKKEYIPQNRTLFMSDWIGDNEYKQAQIGSSPSAEEEAIGRPNTTFYAAQRYSGASGIRRFGKRGSHAGRTAPTRRESWQAYQDRPGNRRG